MTMTAQIGDRCRFYGEKFTIVKYRDPIRFDPRDYGMEPESACTACYRGFWCEYAVIEGRVVLENLFINTKNDQYPPIAGVFPDVVGDDMEKLIEYMGHHAYHGLYLPVKYTGSFLVGSKFLREFYVHAGFQAPWCWQILKEYIFQDGEIVKTNDHSEYGRKIRKLLQTEPNLKDKVFGFACDIPREYLDAEGIDVWWIEDYVKNNKAKTGYVSTA